MPNSPNPGDNHERLALIQRLWSELKATPKDSKKYESLISRIRKETNAFRETLSNDDPTKF